MVPQSLHKIMRVHEEGGAIASSTIKIMRVVENAVMSALKRAKLRLAA